MANNKTLVDENAALKSENEALAKRLEAIEAKLNPKPKAKVKPPETPKETFEVDGTKYKFIIAQYYGFDEAQRPKLILAKEALEMPAELERLVTEKCGVIEKV